MPWHLCPVDGHIIDRWLPERDWRPWHYGYAGAVEPVWEPPPTLDRVPVVRLASTLEWLRQQALLDSVVTICRIQSRTGQARIACSALQQTMAA